MRIIVKKGLDVPVSGGPEGPIQELPKPKFVALNLDPFDTTRFKVHAIVGESVKIGTPLVESKSVPGQMFVSPAAGVITEIRRGLKRRLLDIIIEVDATETYEEHGSHENDGREALLDLFMQSGMFPHIRMRPFDLLADPKHTPRAIFVRAMETLPFVPSAEMQVEEHERAFQAGLDALKKLTDGAVHLVYQEGTPCSAFSGAQNVEKHTASGPHPAGTSSVHIHNIAPIEHAEDYVWTLSTLDVITVGKMVTEGRYFIDRLLSVGGSGVVEGRSGYFRGRAGFPVEGLLSDRIRDEPLSLISGDPLTGTKVESHDFMGFYHTTLSVIPENTTRQLLHFFRLGLDKYTATSTYFTGHVKPPEEGYAFTTNQHGEERAFIDGAVYERVMPMQIPTMHLVKAVIAEDYELAERLGLLEVTGEDFALSAFICPSKIEMIQIIHDGLHRYSKEMGH